MPFAKLWFDQRKEEDGSAKCIKTPWVESIQQLIFNLGIHSTQGPRITLILVPVKNFETTWNIYWTDVIFPT